ncbi:ECF-type sigma factor [Sphaerotilus mobilis]|uniref:DNA-directed RNA polymerase specialized sigma24 family protein n=1 Tax=Sphaerotilus mobilis TaxID=47994 RepID=A0A4Q7LS36_9BURK|nr:ECF-type sigma factor [Sphaerotilus mobilis]RZS57112.1 DNA-directed RNA polymerase specialized sigma24 family protein [Sphaerotilus mobilis]
MAENPSKSRPGQADAQQAAEWAQQGAAGRNRAAALLLDTWLRRLIAYLAYHGRVAEATAEDLAAESITDFVLKPQPRDCPADVWLMTIARNKLIDHAREKNAAKRGGGKAEQALDEDDLLELLDTGHGHSEMPAWVRRCVHLAAAEMQRTEPRHAEVLRMACEGWSAEEVAVHFGAPADAVTDKHKAAARDRIYRAVLIAREMFAPCKE